VRGDCGRCVTTGVTTTRFSGSSRRVRWIWPGFAFHQCQRALNDPFRGLVWLSLQGVLYDNDSQIVEITARRHDDAGNPRVVVSAEAV
jgi:hypothetical protein